MSLRRLLIFAPPLAAFLALAIPVSALDFAGENLTYEFGWSGISAATARIAVTKVIDRSVPCYQIVIDLQGQPKLDWIWKVRDRIETVSTVADLQCHRFFFQQREAKFSLDTDVRLDSGRQMLIGSRTRYRPDKTQTLAPGEAPCNYFDPLSALFFVRRLTPGVGQSQSLKVFDGKRSHDLTYTTLAEETIVTKLGSFITWKVQPRIVRSSGKDDASKVNKVRTAYLWVDKNEPHHIVRIESEAFVGKIFAELTSR